MTPLHATIPQRLAEALENNPSAYPLFLTACDVQGLSVGVTKYLALKVDADAGQWAEIERVVFAGLEVGNG